MATFDVAKINTYTNLVLKEECRKCKLKVGGNKKDLSDRLKEFYQEKECKEDDGKEDDDIEELEKKMKKLQVKGKEADGPELKKAIVIYPDLSSTSIQFARKRGLDLVVWARKLKKTRMERDAYWAQRGI
jgi:SAP domain.